MANKKLDKTINISNELYDIDAHTLDGRHADDFAKKANGIFYVVGTGTTAGTWTGTSDIITEYYDGLTIAYKINIAGASTTTLNINGLGAKTVYLRGTTKVTTHYPVDTVVIAVYTTVSGTGRWYINDYDTNSETTLTISDKPTSTPPVDTAYVVTNLTEGGTKGHTVSAAYTAMPTTDYVDNKIADLINSAPEALDTLGELATALNNHEDAYDALLETVGKKIGQIEADAGTNINAVGTPSVVATNNGDKTTLTFNYLKGAKGDKGDTGTNGTNGTSAAWFTGTTVTGTSTSAASFTVSGSKTGDMYLNTSTYNVYRASAANKWIYVCNIRGAKGSTGDTGASITDVTITKV